jgi:hypothetical protein
MNTSLALLLSLACLLVGCQEKETPPQELEEMAVLEEEESEEIFQQGEVVLLGEEGSQEILIREEPNQPDSLQVPETIR